MDGLTWFGRRVLDGEEKHISSTRILAKKIVVPKQIKVIITASSPINFFMV